MEKERELAYARQSVGILLTSLELMAGGRPEFYRVAAVQLRLLLCDSTRQHGQVVDISLAGRLWPDLRLPALGPGEESIELPRAAWLEQRPEPEGLTIRGLIRRVCDQDGGAHVDPKPQAGLPPELDPAGAMARVGEVVGAALARRLFDR